MLASSLHTVSRCKICRKEQITALIHSSSALSKHVLKKKAISKQGSSHRRLVDNLRPSSKSDRFEVVPNDLKVKYLR
ncbi:hypothetical protein BDQ12DRAFT_319536 [Crucibulum laeve]|uniref:Uncharacterized protein n=1 Tax=Crucibulum laeve TaxID=68775 RepID=A0A5C3LFZ8_9AGAR|nr:hypothetical protein BDQ12DRAFT_319536 [Crucibulum laeve]